MSPMGGDAVLKNTQGHERAAAKRQLRNFASTLLAVFVTSSIGGYYWGHARSINFDDQSESPPLIRGYVASKADRTDTVVFRATYTDGRLASLKKLRELSFACGDRIFLYNEDKNSIQQITDVQSSSVVPSPLPRNGLKFTDTMAFFIGGAGAYSLKEVAPRVKETASEAKGSPRVGFVIALLTVIPAGVATGFWAGYEDQPKCGSELFQKLLQDKVFWTGVDKIYRDHDPGWMFSKFEDFVFVKRENVPSPPPKDFSSTCRPTIFSIFDHSCKQYVGDFESDFEFEGALIEETARTKRLTGVDCGEMRIGAASYLDTRCQQQRNAEASLWTLFSFTNVECRSHTNSSTIEYTFKPAPSDLRHDLEASGQVTSLTLIDKQAGQILVLDQTMYERLAK
jgi:hypothetical protein